MLLSYDNSAMSSDAPRATTPDSAYPESFANINVKDVANWLYGIGLEKHVDAFVEDEVDGEALSMATHSFLRCLGLKAKDRMKVLRESKPWLVLESKKTALPVLSEGSGDVSEMSESAVEEVAPQVAYPTAVNYPPEGNYPTVAYRSTVAPVADHQVYAPVADHQVYVNPEVAFPWYENVPNEEVVLPSLSQLSSEVAKNEISVPTFEYAPMVAQVNTVPAERFHTEISTSLEQLDIPMEQEMKRRCSMVVEEPMQTLPTANVEDLWGPETAMSDAGCTTVSDDAVSTAGSLITEANRRLFEAVAKEEFVSKLSNFNASRRQQQVDWVALSKAEKVAKAKKDEEQRIAFEAERTLLKYQSTASLTSEKHTMKVSRRDGSVHPALNAARKYAAIFFNLKKLESICKQCPLNADVLAKCDAQQSGAEFDKAVECARETGFEGKVFLQKSAAEELMAARHAYGKLKEEVEQLIFNEKARKVEFDRALESKRACREYSKMSRNVRQFGAKKKNRSSSSYKAFRSRIPKDQKSWVKWIKNLVCYIEPFGVNKFQMKLVHSIGEIQFANWNSNVVKALLSSIEHFNLSKTIEESATGISTYRALTLQYEPNSRLMKSFESAVRIQCDRLDKPYPDFKAIAAEAVSPVFVKENTKTSSKKSKVVITTLKDLRKGSMKKMSRSERNRLKKAALKKKTDA